MKQFMNDDFLLNSETARELYHNHAKKMPIFDFHCHLPPREIAEDQRFENLGQIWLAGDHYKWRAMRTAGIDERFITGDSTWREKFDAWAKTVPATIGNPLYHWTHLELQRYFDIAEPLGPDTASAIWDRANTHVAEDNFSVRNLLTRMDVRYVGTTDDPTDDLTHHKAIAGSGFPVTVRPSFRPDKAYAIHDPAAFTEWIGSLAATANMDRIETFEELREALRRRITYFTEAGCRVSDHALVLPVNADYTEGLLNGILTSVLRGGKPSPEDVEAFTTAVLEFVAREYAERGWVFQLHIGALRNNNSRMYEKLGPDSGFDSIVDGPIAEKLAGFLDRLDRDGALPKTVLYGLNPRDNELLATMLGNFQDGTIPGKIQHGSGWWFNDQKDGMIRQMTSLANLSLLSRFIGMLTDSRSFLSFPRHEYFRRILSELVGGWVENGEAPRDMKLLGEMVENICWYNAHDYFAIEDVPREV